APLRAHRHQLRRAGELRLPAARGNAEEQSGHAAATSRLIAGDHKGEIVVSLKGRILAGAVALGTALALASPAAAQFGGACDREMLQEVAGKYLEAQRTGTPLLIPMGNWMVYSENFKLSSMSTGLLSK